LLGFRGLFNENLLLDARPDCIGKQVSMSKTLSRGEYMSSFVTTCFVVLGLFWMTACSTTDKKPVPKIDKESIRNTIHNHTVGIKNCYEDLLQRNPEAKGKITLAWTISDGGKIKNLKFKKTNMAEEKFDACVLDYWKDVVFIEPPKNLEADISYSFVFSQTQ
jgi:hypothetical protein